MAARYKYILGINSVYHQSSAAIIVDGEIVAAVEEERFNRIKHGKAAVVDNTLILPYASIDYCLKEAGITFKDLDCIGYSFNIVEREKQEDYLISLGPVLSGGYKTREGESRFRRFNGLVPKLLAARYDLRSEEESELLKKFIYLDHHLCHLASAYYASPFDDAAVLAIDGIGEIETTTMAMGKGNNLTFLQDIQYPHSLGFLWEIITTYLGFEGNYDECKVMGLASYGDCNHYRDAMGKIINVKEDGTFTINNLDRKLHDGDFSSIEKLFQERKRVPFEPVRYQGERKSHADIAASLQNVTEKVFLRLSRVLYEKTNSDNLAMAGGVTLNCVANGVLARHSPFKDLYVQPAASDAGTALGAALYIYHNQKGNGEVPRCRMKSVYLGPEYSEEEILEVIKKYKLSLRPIVNPEREAAELIAAGKVIGWFNGRMEFGPRALGNRSILADPRSAAMRERLNIKVKHREQFRPFCPTILAEKTSEWLEIDSHLVFAAEYMLVTYFVRPEKRNLIPAITHVDGTSRVQVLHEEANPSYYRLIKEFEKITGVPIVLNTSFNDREPIVCSPEDAALCFLKTQIDSIIMGNHIVEGPKPWEREGWRRTFIDEVIDFKSKL